jgi:hypothetical protein
LAYDEPSAPSCPFRITEQRAAIKKREGGQSWTKEAL